jgi:hypothetical protein
MGSVFERHWTAQMVVRRVRVIAENGFAYDDLWDRLYQLEELGLDSEKLDDDVVRYCCDLMKEVCQ